tara:strand:- start:2800 stop:3642 length:843 start_codon:yes stop_codon:yes gene_type:complete
MADITAAQVKALRQLTDLPMMECKNALVEADGDQEKAIEILKEQNQKVMLKRADNATSEGRISIAVSEDGSSAAMIELQCESAPVANNDEFRALADSCAAQLLAGPGADSPDDLLDQSPGDTGTLRETYEDVLNKIREKIVLARVVRVDGPAAGYVHHDGKTGVLFQASTGEDTDGAATDVLRDVAMHIAAMKSSVVDPDDLDEATVNEERERLSEEARATGKPEEIIEKIVDGRMKVFYQEQGVLSAQQFVKEESKTVSQVLAENGLAAKGFTRWVLGN